MKGKRDNSHICLMPKIILLTLFLDMVPSSSVYTVTTHVAWMLSWRMKMHVKSIGLFTRVNVLQRVGNFHHLLVYLPNYLFNYLPIYLINHLSTYLSMRLFIYSTIYLFVFVPIYLFIYLSIHLFIYSIVYLFIYSSIYLFIFYTEIDSM